LSIKPRKSAVTVSDRQIDQMRRMLQDLPQKPQTAFSARETVQALASEIHHAIDVLGYSLTDIARMVGEAGAEISPGTLASYLRESKTAASKKRKQVPSRKTVHEGGINFRPIEEEDLLDDARRR